MRGRDHHTNARLALGHGRVADGSSKNACFIQFAAELRRHRGTGRLEVDVVVLARGVFGKLGVCAETETLLRERSIPYHVENTKQGVALFNDLAKQGKRVGGLFHSTC